MVALHDVSFVDESGTGGVPPVGGYIAWYDPADSATVTLAGGSNVSQLNDKSGNGNHLTQANSALQPLWGRHPSLFNKRRALFFALCNSTVGNLLSSSASMSDLSSTLFVVGSPSDLASGPRTLAASSAANGNQFRLTTGGACESLKQNVGSLGIQSNASTSVGAAFTAVQALTASDVTHYMNGTSETDAHAQTFTAALTLNLGRRSGTGTAGEPWFGWIGEVIMYDTTLSGADITLVSDYLRSKWATS